MKDSTVLASSLLPLPPPRLVGYARLGADLILGDSGRAVHGPVGPGGDGAYVSIEQDAAGAAVIGVDHTGYAKTYLYRHGERWALGTSFIELAEYASSHGWQLTINEPQLKTFLLQGGMIAAQVTSSQTPFREITLLAPTERAVVSASPHGPRVETHHTTPDAPADYRTALTYALNEMVGLMGALLDSDLPVRSEITGGKDSRCVLASILTAHGPDPTPVGQKVQFRCGEQATNDFRIASQLSEKYQLQLNRPAPGLSGPISSEEGYALWRRQELGLNNAIWPMSSYRRGLTLNGIGGEANRLAYRAPTMAKQLMWSRSDHLTDEDRQALVDAMEESLAQIPEHPDGRITHYRSFRNRFHGGRLPLRFLTLSPLDSRAFRSAAALLSPEDFERSQLNADILFNLAPLLATHPFDEPGKELTTEQEAHLTRVDVDVARVRGQVMGQEDDDHPVVTPTARELDPFRDAFEAAAPAARASGLLPDAVVEEGRQALREAGPRKFSHAVRGGPVALTILVAELLRLAS